jgi:hypothetical protein
VIKVRCDRFEVNAGEADNDVEGKDGRAEREERRRASKVQEVASELYQHGMERKMGVKTNGEAKLV